jgi:hypothetical protein
MTRFSSPRALFNAAAVAGFLATPLVAQNAIEDSLPIPQDPDATIKKAKPADEMLGEQASTGTDLDVDPDSATVDGAPRTSETSFVNTEEDEAEVGIPTSD